MTKFLFSIVLCISGLISAFGQDNQIQWTTSVEQIHKDTFLIKFKAEPLPGWVVYSQHIGADGPVPTTFTFDESKKIIPVGNVEEPIDEAVTEYDSLFFMDIRKYKHTTVFTQKVYAKCSSKINAQVNYMTCDNKRCMPPKTEEFLIKVNK